MLKDGAFQEMKRRTHYEKPGALVIRRHRLLKTRGTGLRFGDDENGTFPVRLEDQRLTRPAR